MRFIGIDLTDPYARRPRSADVAIIDGQGACHFVAVPAPRVGGSVAGWLAPVGATPTSGDVLVIDGPLGLANVGEPMRDCERLLGAPGKTPDALPVAGSRPFAGYVRGSVEMANALLAAGWVLFDGSKPPTMATLLEAFPGGTWQVLAGRKLDHKTTVSGMRARADLLMSHGLQFARAPQSHDALDAALCAWLGWMLHQQPGRVRTVGRPSCRESGCTREGVILQVAGIARSLHPAVTQRPAAMRTAAPRTASVLGLPPDVHPDWTYFATPARADFWETAELAVGEGVICRSAHNRVGALIANVGNVRAGEVILLAYATGRGACQVIGAFRVEQPRTPVRDAPALHEIDEPALAAQVAVNYPQDPSLGVHTAFLVEAVWTPDPGVPVTIVRPVGNNSLWRT